MSRQEERGGKGHAGPLIEALRGDPAKVEYYRGLLAPLEAYDREHHGDLVKTLAAYLRHGGNATRTADALFLHRNSLRYRLARIGALTGLNIEEANDRLALQIAVLLEEDGSSTP